MPRADSPQEPNRLLTDRDHEAEYQRLLAYQTVDELRALARHWDVKLRDVHADTPHPKEAIVEQMAARLCDPQAIAVHINALDEPGRHMLVYIHLTLAPEYGLAAENILRGLARQSARAAQLADSEELFQAETPSVVTAHTQRVQPTQRLHPTQRVHPTREIGHAQEYRRAAQEQITALVQQGLLLPFRQGNTLYYTLPMAVRAYLPSIPDLFAYTQESDALDVDTRTVSSVFQALFVVWNTLAKGSPGRERPFYRQSPLVRQPLEDQWAALRGWDHDPAEIQVLARGRYARGSATGDRAAPARLDRISSATLNWAVTIPAPMYRLGGDDRRLIREVTGHPDPEIEFYYALLEGLGALSGAAGEPIDTDKEALLRFLRLPSADKVRTLWQVWALAEDWGEMGAGLGTLSSEVRLRRSLAYPQYKATDLYQEWRSGRQAILRYLSLLPEDRWISVKGFLGTVFQVDPNLLHAQTDPSVWWLESTKTGKQFGTTFEDWQQSYGRFVLAIIEGPLAWLGMVRLGYRAAEQPVPRGKTLEAFQLTPAGAFALGRRPTLTRENFDASLQTATGAAAEPFCVVNDDLTVVLAPGRAPLELHDLLHSVGRLLEATPERFLYRLTTDRVFRWVEDTVPDGSTPRGSSPSEPAIEMLIATIARYAAVPGARTGIPVWQEKLRTWGRNYGRLHVYENLTLIELADDYALQELLVSTSLRQHLIYQFSPRLVAIRADAVEDLVQEMETRGYTPRVE
jgi:hypothetical protein